MFLHPGDYTWPLGLSDFNVAPVFNGTGTSFTAPSFWGIASTGSDKVYIDMNFTGFLNGATIEQIRLDLNNNGSSLVRSLTGGHCVLPASQIPPNGTGGGVLSPNF